MNYSVPHALKVVYSPVKGRMVALFQVDKPVGKSHSKTTKITATLRMVA